MDGEPKENSDLLSSGRKNLAIVELKEKDLQLVSVPPDGGFKAYVVVLASFLTNGLLFGVINSFGIILEELKTEKNKPPNYEARAALVGSLSLGVTFFLSPLSGVLTGFLGLRLTAILGGSIAAAGLFLSSFVVDNVNALCFTYGILYGMGAALAYTPSLAILGHYFKKKLGIVNGFVTVGSSIFTVILTYLMDKMIKNLGLAWMFRILAVLTVFIAFCGLLFKPISLVDKTQKQERNLRNLMKSVVNVELWRNRKYKMWALLMPVALFGYFVPYLQIKDFIIYLKIQEEYQNIPLQCMAVTSGIGRLLFGYLADLRSVDNILLQQISFYVIGILTIVLAYVRSFVWLIAVVVGIGLFEGGFIALIGPIAFELCGAEHASQSIGWMLGFAAIPIVIGPPIAVAVKEHFNSYTWLFALAGFSPLIGATMMFIIRFHKGRNETTEANTNGHIPLSTNDAEKGPIPMLTSNGKPR